MALTLNSGFKMPIIGLGVWRMEGKEIRDLIINAINIGYRHFDCAGESSIAEEGFWHGGIESTATARVAIQIEDRDGGAWSGGG
ncbi:hypothetical protein LWI29_011590 [Acer saccharum]|uniref:Sorbitol-6-phosphate dehydrogenase n=1 Tax=Acer saccharum TaxID=4024 RepID=A0AA39VIV5_ACESA|nr:hypothetical protein LWI29_011590 [Acer saccharum]